MKKKIKSEGKEEYWADEYKCPHCGVLIMSWSYCPRCGKSLKNFEFVGEDD